MRSQQERTEKMNAKITKLNVQRGKRKKQQKEAETECEYEDSQLLPSTRRAPTESKQAESRPVPEAWNCSIYEASKGRFVVVETIYNRPKRRGIIVGQVTIFMFLRFTIIC